uniref:Protein FAM184A/B N-terminal domain-containing protein n=2 Tax=Gallus gallus TaxID=9031 RepID=A0A8V0Y7J5_CHICK
MASSINKSRQPGTCNGSKAPRGSSAEGYNKEIHMQMCKKIAQLTKVIYALNTKNDEHEDSIQALREAHEEEVQHILAEMKETIVQYKSKVEEEQLLRKHIQALETAVEQHRRVKEEALAELTQCKKQVEEREPRAKVKLTQMALSKDTVDTNADFENKLPHLNEETNGLLNECKLSRRENLDEDILAEKISMEGQVLVNEMENLRSENQGAIKEYTQKTNQLRASCERGRESTQQSMTETKNHHQQREMEQRNCSEVEKGFWMQQVKKLEADLEEKSQKINEKKKHSQKLKERIQELQMQLDEFKRKSECEIKQLEKEKEALTGKLQNSSLENSVMSKLLILL